MNVRIIKNSKAILLLLGFAAFMPIGAKAQKTDSIKKKDSVSKANSIKQPKRVIITLKGTFKGPKDSTNFTQIPADNLPGYIHSAPARKKRKNALKATAPPASETAPAKKTDDRPKAENLKKTKAVPVAKKPAQKTKNDGKASAPNPLKPEANLNGSDAATENDSGYVAATDNNNQTVGLVSNPAKVAKKDTVSFVWIGAILIIIGILLGFIVNRLGFVLSAVGLILILIGVFVF